MQINDANTYCVRKVQSINMKKDEEKMISFMKKES